MECLLWDSFLWLAFASASTDFHKEAPVDLTNSGHQSEPQRHWASLQRKPRMRKQLWINRVKIYTLTKISWYCNHSSVPPLKHMFLGPWFFLFGTSSPCGLPQGLPWFVSRIFAEPQGFSGSEFSWQRLILGGEQPLILHQNHLGDAELYVYLVGGFNPFEKY